MAGWIKLHRSIVDWEWYDDINTTRLFIHLLLVANHSAQKWRGITIDRGQKLTSLERLSKETGLSVSKIRTSIKKLILTDEIASQSHAQYTVFTIKNYDYYQGVDKPIADESQAIDKPVTTNKNEKNEEKGKKETKDSVQEKIPFSDFWARYPKKTEKADAEKKWPKLSLEDQQAAMADCEVRYVGTEKQYIRGGCVYLNKRTWEDEIVRPTQSTGYQKPQHQAPNLQEL